MEINYEDFKKVLIKVEQYRGKEKRES